MIGIVGRWGKVVLLLWADGDTTALRWEEWQAVARGDASIWRSA